MYIFEINSLSIASFAVIFSHSEGCLFTLLIVSFVVQKLLILIRSICLSKHKTRNYKILEENIGKTLCDINHSRILYDPPPRILEIKVLSFLKIEKWPYYFLMLHYFNLNYKNYKHIISFKMFWAISFCGQGKIKLFRYILF